MAESNPVQSEHDVRLDKVKQLQALGINPYPSKYKHNLTHNTKSALDLKMDEPVVIAGRIMLMREMGGLIFATLQDNYGQIQLVFEKKSLKDINYEGTDINLFTFVKKFLDIGDFIGVQGKTFTTKKGEFSILIDSYELLTKAIAPLPDKWHGIKDAEERYRKRYLDILMNRDVHEMFVKKAKFWNSIRKFMLAQNFLEVETPVLETTTGGADAEPFKTHHNALDIDVYLRISCGELWQKMLMVAGYEKVFEIGRIFRNEGMDSEHLQDYTQMEFYWAYADYNDSRKLVEAMYKYVAQETFGTLKFKIKDFDVDLGQVWELYDFREQILTKTKIDIATASLEDMKAKLDNLKVKYDKSLNKGRAMDYLWKYCRKQLAGPGFLINHPVEVSPLAKKQTDNPNFVQRYQVILAGSEIGNGYSELNDPIDQAQRFNEQAKLRASGDKEAQMFAHEFIESLEYGMPPTSGFGVSERLFSFLMDASVRETVIFPLMKPEHQPVAVNVADAAPGEKVKLPITRQEAWELVQKHTKNQQNINHYLESEAIMRELAEHLGEDVELWGMTGLLHDLDWDETMDLPNVEEVHTRKTVEYLKPYNLPESMIYAIQSHCNEIMDNIAPPQSKLDYALRAAETITGLIFAYTLMRPDKKVEGVEVKSIKKKMKDKSFAAKVNRDMIKECEHLGLSLDEFIEISLRAFRKIADQIGL